MTPRIATRAGRAPSNYARRTGRRFIHAIGFEYEIQNGLKKAGKKQKSGLFASVVDFHPPGNHERCHHEGSKRESHENQLHGIENFKGVLGDKEGKAEYRRVADASGKGEASFHCGDSSTAGGSWQPERNAGMHIRLGYVIVKIEVQHMDENIEAFWAKFEKETGEKVLARTMSQYFATPKDRGDWGLLVLSPTGIRFRKTPGENWFASLFKASASSLTPSSEEDIFIPYASIEGISNPPRKFLDFLFGTPFLAIIIAFAKNGEAQEARFAVDPKGDFLEKLKEFAKKS